MVVVLDIEVLRALVGDYKTVVIRKNSIKCYGFHDKVYDAKDILDIGLPKREDIKRILLIGSGPIVIGQACEFDFKK